MASTPDSTPRQLRTALAAVTVALVLLLAQVAFIADSPFTRQSYLAAPALICVFILAVASAFSILRSQFALRERARDESVDALAQSIYKRCLFGALAALACASAALGFCIFVLSHYSR